MLRIEATSVASFNPHTHEGCDSIMLSLHSISRVSIHTPTKGVTPMFQQVLALIWVSIHTPTKGVTYIRYTHTHTYIVSIHTPTKGVT